MCTRAMYRGDDGLIVVGRSMDWREDPHSDLWVFPRGMERDGATGPGALTWTSRHGSLVASFYGVASVDGVNEAGLVANALYLAESDYGTSNGSRPTMAVTAWLQYVLDSFATVDEVVDDLEREGFCVVAPVLPDGSPATGHVAVSDPSGDSAIFEYLGGRLVVHHGREFPVMTNSPSFDQQLALNAYWKQIGGLVMLPGTNRAADRFARASFYIDAIPRTVDPARAVAAVASVIRCTSVPLGLGTPDHPDISSTVWRTVIDQTHRVLFWDSATSPNVFWVPLEELDFSEGAPAKRLELGDGSIYGGDASGEFVETQPFPFLAAAPAAS